MTEPPEKDLIQQWQEQIAKYMPKGSEEAPTLRPPHDEIKPSFMELHGRDTALGFLAVVAFVALVVRITRRPAQVITIPPVEIALRDLERLRAIAVNETTLVEISRILRRYLIAALNLPPEEFTTPELKRALETNSQLQPELAQAVTDFYRRIDKQKFAPAAASSGERLAKSLRTAILAPPIIAGTDFISEAKALVEKVEAQNREKAEVLPLPKGEGGVRGKSASSPPDPA